MSSTAFDRAGKSGGDAGNGGRNRLVVVSNRVADLTAAHQSGGLAVAVAEALEASGGIWFGWSGDVDANAAAISPKLRTSGNVSTATIPLTNEEHEDYYLGYSNRTLWPLFHYRLDIADLSGRWDETYFAVNKRFAAGVGPLLTSGDTIWVHDYQLIPFGAHLRQRGVENPIGFFLHIPFPPPELFAALPRHADLARTLFAYDLVGFQTVRDRENFARYAETYLHCRRLPDGRLKGFGRKLRIEAVPIGIEADTFAADAERSARSPELRQLARSADGQQLIVGVDRLDYSKGLPDRIRAVGALLAKAPQFAGKVQMIQIAPPTREGVEAYDAIRHDLEQAASQVNGKYGDFSWQPIRYLHRPVPRPVIAGLFRRSRVGLVTPLRDGMNLVAKEYVAAQDPADPGVLVLSQFAGAAEQLEDALIVNPHDTDGVADAIRRGLEMPLGERQARYRALWQRVQGENVKWWRDRFLSLLAETSAPQRPAHVAQVTIKSEALPHDEKPDTPPL